MGHDHLFGILQKFKLKIENRAIRRVIINAVRLINSLFLAGINRTISAPIKGEMPTRVNKLMRLPPKLQQLNLVRR